MAAMRLLVTVALLGACLGMACARGHAQEVAETLSLEQAIALALTHNPQVGAAEDGVRETQWRLTQARSLLLPRVSMNARRMTPVNLPDFSFQSRETTWETDLSLTQPLYTGGSIQQGIAAARDYLRGSEGAYRRTQQEIAFAVRQSYYRVLTAEEGVNVAAEVVASVREHLRVARLRFQAGLAPQFDVLAAEARLARVEQGLIAAQAERSIAWAALSAVLGRPVPEGTQLTTPRPVSIEEADVESLKQEALEKRPDLLAMEARATAAGAEVRIAQAQRQPSVAANISYTLRDDVTIAGEAFGLPGQELVVAQDSGYILLVVSWSLFNGGQVHGEIRAAQARMDQAAKLLESQRQRIELEVKSAYLQLEAARAQVAAAQKEVEQAQEAHRIATLRYEEGVGTSVEILDAEASLEGAKTRLNGAIYGLNLAVAQLDLAVGRDWHEGLATTSELEAVGG